MNPESREPVPALSGAEWEVMNIFWQRGELAAREVYDALPHGRDWAYNTVKTLLSRLVAKGALDYKQVGNAYLYRPAAEREQLARREVQGLLDRVLSGAAGCAAVYFVEKADLNEEEIGRLQQILNRKSRGNRGKSKGEGR